MPKKYKCFGKLFCFVMLLFIFFHVFLFCFCFQRKNNKHKTKKTSSDVESLNKSLQTQSIHYAPENGMLTSLVANHSPINSYQSNKKSPDDDTDPDLIPNQYGNYLLYEVVYYGRYK